MKLTESKCTCEFCEMDAAIQRIRKKLPKKDADEIEDIFETLCDEIMKLDLQLGLRRN